MEFVDDDHESPTSRWCDRWVYDDLRWPVPAGFAALGPVKGLEAMTPISYDDVLPGAHDQAAPLADIDLNDVEASMCFPTVPKFCGQTFVEREDKELALLCVMAYNDWMIEDWCASPGAGRLIPLTLVPLWDAGLAAAEVRRCAVRVSGRTCASASTSLAWKHSSRSRRSYSAGRTFMSIPTVSSGCADSTSSVGSTYRFP